ncbi:hypothetical protein AWZ03_012920 [Drosophila navojoa]|uniref:Acylphosphatase-like domain-containing protein n=1 Tax=Drosophila navojoa TaxID=7232 RepID=A0A484AVN1_DRONA|nr:hypothetical protein AWZ03_012920 [Drosophila navojoa]
MEMDLIKSSFSFNSAVYLRLVASRMLSERSECDDSKINIDDNSSSVTDPEAGLCFCMCKLCRDRRKTAINKDTIFHVEFQLHKLRASDEYIPSILISQCRAMGLNGYVIFTYEREDCSGVVEGSIKRINEFKSWVHTLNDHIPQPMSENIYFSWFLITRPALLQPEFDERITPPYVTSKMVSGDSSDE